MGSLTKYEALQYWKQKRKTSLKRTWIEGHTLFTVCYDPVSLKSEQLSRLIRTKIELCLFLHEMPMFMPTPFLGGLNWITPSLPLCSFISRYLNKHHLKACNEKLSAAPIKTYKQIFTYFTVLTQKVLYKE